MEAPLGIYVLLFRQMEGGELFLYLSLFNYFHLINILMPAGLRGGVFGHTYLGYPSLSCCLLKSNSGALVACLVPPRLAFLGIDIWREFSGCAPDYGYSSNRSQTLSFVTAQVHDRRNSMK